MWTKKTVMVICLLALVLGSCFAWPAGAVKENAEAVVEPVEKKSETTSLKQAEDLQSAVSTAREALSGKKLTKEEVAAITTTLDNAEAGINAMTMAYNDLAGFHMGIVPAVGYTIGQPIEKAFDIGFNLVANYKNLYATIGANKGVDIKNFKGSFTSWDGLRCSLGVGFQLF